MPGENPLIIMDEMQTDADWLTDANDFMQEAEFEEAMRITAKILAEKGNVPQPNVAALCVKLEALAIIYRMRYNAYQSYLKGTTNARDKKNHYYSLVEGIDNLVQSLKYLLR